MELNWIFWLIVDVPVLAGLVGLIVYYEWRRRERIRDGLPLEDQPPTGFPVEGAGRRNTPTGKDEG